MFPQVLSSNKLRLASFGVAGTMLASALFPSALVYAAQAAPTTKDVTAGEVESALTHANDILASSSQTHTTSDSNTALKSAVGGATVTVPKNASSGLTLGATDGTQLNVQLPNASQASSATQVANGVVAYAGTNGSANAVQTTSDGGVRMLTVIDNQSAPTTYDYKITVPHGGTIKLFPDNSGVILNSSGRAVAFIAIPWATDATGKHIQTYFTTDGTTLIQHILHNVPGVMYPVTADPNVYWSWWGVTIYINQGTVNRISGLLATGAGIMSVGAAVVSSSGAGAPPAAVVWAIGAGVAGIGTGVLQWCSWRGNGTWLHIHYWGLSWCNG